MVALTAGSCSVQQLLALEVDLLHSLGWELSQPTSLAFLHLYLQAMQGAVGPLACLADCLLELSLLGVGEAPDQPGSAALQPSRSAALALSTALFTSGQQHLVPRVLQLDTWDGQPGLHHLAQVRAPSQPPTTMQPAASQLLGSF
ncbi:hypothetical protein HaLaN_10066 [Haematococcus lacustris]|uniref:Cyclin N-terminal domain-containing protein n=1 Tax=Haematococcus lacustris TaxID=44745 RepID=A0A699YV73_HAELA|nr:hypothetical protein HaLaN_10066 [Haematococcus lacustris]